MTDRSRAPLADRDHAAALRELLQRAGYSRDGIQGALGVSGDLLSRTLERPIYLRRMADRAGALETLIRLFLLDATVEPEVAERAFAPTGLEPLVALGLIEERAGELHGLARVVPHGDIVVISDQPDREKIHSDHVAGIHRPSITLADLTVRRPVGTALDMGTGCGIQAILASRHAEHVVATDINERALAFAALNAALNEAENIEFRAGSFFEPVAGETFELVVTNPPYVISPENAYVFRDSGLGRDRVSERLVAELPGFLAEGAFGTIMASWIHEGDDPSARPRQWLEGSQCDAWILHTGIEDPLAAAANWNRDLAKDEAKYGEAVDRWLAYFREEGIGALAYGSIVMRRRTGAANWVRNRELPNEPRRRPEAHLLRLFTGQDLSSDLASDDALAGLRLALAPGATITSRLRRREDEWAEAAEFTLDEGIPFSAELDSFTAQFLARLDGTTSLGDVLAAFAVQHQAPADQVRASGLQMARSMLEQGFAEPRTAEI